jgi:WD40 repeat protein
LETPSAAHATFSLDGRLVLAAARDTNAYLWDMKRGDARAQVYRGHQDSLNCVALSLDERRIATASVNGSIRVWDRATAQTLLRFHHPGVTRVAFTAGGRLVSAGADGTVRWWLLETGALRRAVEALDVPESSADDKARLAHLLDR